MYKTEMSTYSRFLLNNKTCSHCTLLENRLRFHTSQLYSAGDCHRGLLDKLRGDDGPVTAVGSALCHYSVQ